MEELKGLTDTQRKLAEGMMAAAPRQNPGRYLGALQAVAQGYRAPKRTVRIREDRSITLYKNLGQDRPKHDSLKERVKHYKRLLKGNPLNASARAEFTRLNDELLARRAGNPTEGFEV